MRKLRKTNDEWRVILAPSVYAVCREHGTEPPFSGEYDGCKKKGTYKCVCCQANLFRSEDKYDSGSGWPSFWQALDDMSIVLKEDHSLGMMRTEVLCAACDSHLGHVFPDGPQPTGMRYCVNSASLLLNEVE
jgi:peptide-methionine (R)-S-oxide reductase